ncbi:MAG: DUF551 domain-containing protein [Zoogloea sp.]|uniref:DUF551 domain-containing protein n=1 Tax=Zoogloea sp. TaxID=49181 RepID=UPI003F34CBC0
MEWISTNDRVPTQSVNVLLCIDGVVGIGSYSPDFGWWVTGADFDDDAQVTHWMPLPAPPSNVKCPT